MIILQRKYTTKMNPTNKPFNIIWLPEAESTNRSVRERIDGCDNMSVIAAVEQTAGRGQGSNTWFATKGLNLTFSFLYRPLKLGTDNILLITCATTLGIRDYLLGHGIEADIKWPNDIWVKGRKICGILIENILEGRQIQSSIIGVGFNLNQMEWPSDLPNPVSLKQLTGRHYSPESELEALMDKICRRFAQVDSCDGRPLLQEEFEKNLIRLA